MIEIVGHIFNTIAYISFLVCITRYFISLVDDEKWVSAMIIIYAMIVFIK